jgi:DNA polymerase III subunit beta
VRRVALLSNERSRAVKFVVENGKVEVTSSSPEFGEAREPLPVDYTARRSPSASTPSMCSTS